MSTDDNDAGVVVCGFANCFDHRPRSVRERFERMDGPYEPINCQTCGRGCLIGRWGRKQLARGVASTVICTDCLIAVAKKLNSEERDGSQDDQAAPL